MPGARPLPPRPAARSSKLNRRVERLNRTFREECWECSDGDLDLPPLQAAVRTPEDEYNRVRPYQALGYLTPAAYLASLPEAHV